MTKKKKQPDPLPIPEPPKIVLAKPRGRKRLFWLYMITVGREVRFQRFDYFGVERPEDLTVIEHPSNSPECVEVIEKAKGEKNG